MNKRYFTISILILLSSLLITRALGQLVQLPNIELITEKDGLPFNSRTCLIQDKRGFIWIGSFEGLARYDGYSFITLQYKPGSKNSLPNNSIVSLEVDHDGIIWAGHIGGYISKIDPYSLQITQIKIDGLDDTSVYKIFCDSKGTIWCSIYSVGLYRYDGKSSFHFICALNDLPQKNNVAPSVYNTITDFYEDEDHNFWMGSPNGIYKFNPVDSSIIHISSLGKENNPASVHQLLPDENGGFWCATWGTGLVHFDVQKNKYEYYTFQPGIQGTTNIVMRVARKSTDELWLSTSGAGILRFNTKSKTFSFFQEKGDQGSGPMFGPMIIGRLGILWVLSDKGLHKWDLNENNFIFSKLKVSHSDNNEYYTTTCILEDQKNGRTIIGTSYADGVHVLTSDGKEKILLFPHHPLAEKFLIVNDLMQDKKGNVYIVTRDFLYALSTSNKLEKIDAINSLLPPSTIPFLYKMIQSENGDLWVLSSRNGLFHLDSKTNKWELLHTDSPYSLVDNKVLRIMEDKNRNLWLMHSRVGLQMYNSEKKTWTSFKYEPQNPNSIASSLLTDITMTTKGEIFISSYDGISKFNPNENTFENHDGTKDLPASLIYSMDSDEEGMLWASTNRGVLRVDPSSWKCQEFSFKDGVDGIYSSFTIRKGTNGRMYIFTFQGFYTFRPAEIAKKKERVTPVLITSIRNLSTSQAEYHITDKFYVDYKTNSITIEFSALNFLNPLKNKYRYRMNGLDQDWIETNDHTANYSGIPSGSYTFHVQLIDGKTKINEGVIKIIVSTPFWKQDWFNMLLVTTVLSATYLIYRLRLNQVRKEEKIKREYNQKLAEVEMKALKAQMNPHFIFNSLNSINRYIVKSEPEKASLYLTKFSKLIRLILDNSNHKIISLENELNALKLYIELERLRFNEKFNYTVHVDEELNPFSIGIPPMIIQPFVENAIWHGLLHKEGPGKLEIRIERYGTGLKCIITDNGVGRKKAIELKSKSINNAKSYGMKITNDRLTMLNGESKISTVEIVDLEDDRGIALGTKVIVKILSAELEPEF